MSIIGLEAVVFGVNDIAACSRYLTDYGLQPVNVTAQGGRFEAMDGTAVIIARRDDPSLPAALDTGSQLRKTILAVSDQATLDAVRLELGKDREVLTLADGSIQVVDDAGFVLGLMVTQRRAITTPGEVVNAPGSTWLRCANLLGVDPAITRFVPRSLSHIVYFVPDVAKAEAFYVQRLGFRCTDRFEGVGPFLQPPGSLEHHTHFFIGAPPQVRGIEHFTFHFAGPSEMIRNGHRFVSMGYQAFWGPGRHIFGSNWFWYFNSPFGCHMEMDADMDLHDSNWRPRSAPISADSSQTFLLRYRPKWSPGPGAPHDGDYA